MPYTTLVSGTTITASWANANVRDQAVTPFATAAARASAITSPIEGMVSYLSDSNDLNVYDGARWVGWMVPSQSTVATSETTVGTAFGDPTTPGPSVTVTTGTRALVTVAAQISNSGANTCLMGVDVSGATTIAANDVRAAKVTGTNSVKASQTFLYAAGTSAGALNSGSNVFKAVYRVSGGTGTFIDRDILVLPLP